MRNDTKFCKNCGKKLPVESIFCPYCMTKLIDVTTGGEIKVKKKKHILIIVIAMVAAITAIAALTLLGNISINNKNSDKPTTPVAEKASATVLETQSESSSIDYSSYIGIWCDKNSDISSSTQNGGNVLEIISIKNDVVRFTFTKTSSAPHNRIARISNVTSQIIDGIGTFSFDDDSWQNSGTGKIKFLDGEIYLETNIINTNSDAMWNIGGKFYLSKSETSILDFKSNDFLGKNFDDVKNIFGEEISDSYFADGKWNIHYYNGFEVKIYSNTNEIFDITVEYSSDKLTKSNICYGNINGNSTYDDVYAELGEPMYNYVSNKKVIYKEENGYITFNFDDNMNLTGFILSIEDMH